jgi:chorismate mutase
MASAKEIQYIIKARDEATAVFKKMGMEGSQSAADISRAFDIATTAGAKHEKQVSSLSSWIRADKKEKREHNYLYKEGTEVIGAASLALALYGNTAGQANEKSKKLTDSLNAGMVGFTGISSALFMLPGPVGIALGVIGGLAIMFKKLGDNTEEAKGKVEQFSKDVKKSLEGWGMEGARKIYDDNYASYNAILLQQQNFIDAYKGQMYGFATGEEYAKVQPAFVDLELQKAKFKAGMEMAREYIDQLNQVERVKERQKASKPVEPPAPPELNIGNNDKLISKYLADRAKMTTAVGKTKKELDKEREAIHHMGIESEKVSNQIKKNWEEENQYLLGPLRAAYYAITDAMISGTLKFQNVWDAVKEAVINAFAEMGMKYITQTIVNAATADATAAATAAIVAGSMVSISAAALPAAVLTSLASFGANSAPAMAGIGSTYALTQALSVIPKFARGTPQGGFVVPQGYQNDSYPILVSSGERVNVTPANKTGGSGSNVTIINNFNGAANYGMVIDAIKQALKEAGTTIDKLFIDNRNNLNLGTV